MLQEVFAAAFNAILADERAINVRPVALPDRAQPLAQPPAQGAGDRRRLDGRPPLRARPDDRRQGAQARGVPAADVGRPGPAGDPAHRAAAARDRRALLRADRRGDGDDGPVGQVAARARARRRSPRRPRRGCSPATRCATSSARSPRACAARPPPVRRHLRTLRPLPGLPQAAAPDQPRARRRLPGRAAAAAQEGAARPRRHGRRRRGGGAAAGGAAAGGAAGAAAGGRSRRRGALASKAVAGLAAAAIVTAGAVEVKHVKDRPARQGATPAQTASRRAGAPRAAAAAEPVPVASAPQPASSREAAVRRTAAAERQRTRSRSTRRAGRRGERRRRAPTPTPTATPAPTATPVPATATPVPTRATRADHGAAARAARTSSTRATRRCCPTDPRRGPAADPDRLTRRSRQPTPAPAATDGADGDADRAATPAP